jgi:hypothetical protein
MDILEDDDIYFFTPLRECFQKNYFETRKIFIAAEQFSNRTNEAMFYYLSEILDEIYSLYGTKNNKEVNKIIGNIETIFLGIQGYTLLTAIGIIEKKYKEINFCKDDIYRIVTTLKKELNEINFSDDFQWCLPRLSKANKEIITKANISIKKAFFDLLQCFSLNFSFNEEDWHYEIDFNKSPLKNKLYIEKFSKLIGNNYKIARAILYDVFKKRMSHFHGSIGDLRDALDHIARSLFLDAEDAIEELICADEHIRRATVESLQECILTLLSKKYSVKLHSNCEISNQELMEKIAQIEKNISIARYIKGSKTWFTALNFFYKALDDTERLGEKNANDTT